MFPQAFRFAVYLRDKLWECPPLLPPLDVRVLARGALAAGCACDAFATGDAFADSGSQSSLAPPACATSEI